MCEFIKPKFQHKNTKFFLNFLPLNQKWQVARTDGVDGEILTFNQLFNLKADAQRFYDDKLAFFKEVIAIKPIRTIQYVLPTFLAVALINGDESGMTTQESENLEDWLENEQTHQEYAVFRCVGCADDAEFKHTHEYDPISHLGADCSTFTFQIS